MEDARYDFGSTDAAAKLSTPKRSVTNRFSARIETGASTLPRRHALTYRDKDHLTATFARTRAAPPSSCARTI